MCGYPEEALRRHVVFKIIEGRVKVLAHLDFSLGTPKRGTGLLLRQRDKLERGSISACDDDFFSLIGLVDETAELLLCIPNTDFLHGWQISPFCRKDISVGIRSGSKVGSECLVGRDNGDIMSTSDWTSCAHPPLSRTPLPSS